jgi:PAS domain S-box-containing protein
MTSDKHHRKRAAELRRLAEEAVRNEQAPLPTSSSDLAEQDTEQILHELRVHQVQLEMQNEDLRQAQEKLDASRARYFDLYDLAPVGYCTLSANGRILKANLTAATLLGVDRATLVQQPFTRFILEEDQHLYTLRQLQGPDIPDPQECELRLKKDDVGSFWAHLTITAVQPAAGQSEYRIVLSDISDRKHAEIRASEQAVFTRRILDSTPAHIALLDPEGMIVDVNTAWTRFAQENNGTEMNKLGPGTSYFCSWSSQYGDITNATEAFAGIRQVQRGERPSFTIEYPCHAPNEQNRWFSLQALPLVGDTGHVLVAHTDISALKQSEQSLAAALAEKDVLLREVHHRVKNNLAAIIGLLDMQRRMLNDQQGRDLLNELSRRIYSMNLIHEKLYRSDNLARIDFHGYTQDLIFHLHTAYGTPRITCQVEAQDVDIPLDIAVPCGMIINELVSNALKYAFPEGTPCSEKNGCRIQVSIRQDNNTYTLAVADNGIGLPPEYDWKAASTLGMILVRMLGCHQLGGEYELDRLNGTRFTLTFTSS